MKEEKSLRLFSDETLDSMTMAMVCGGEGGNNCHGGNCGNCVQGCGGSGNNTSPGCGASINTNVSVVCNCGNTSTGKQQPNQTWF